jgi:hypothetical protein
VEIVDHVVQRTDGFAASAPVTFRTPIPTRRALRSVFQNTRASQPIRRTTCSPRRSNALSRMAVAEAALFDAAVAARASALWVDSTPGAIGDRERLLRLRKRGAASRVSVASTRHIEQLADECVAFTRELQKRLQARMHNHSCAPLVEDGTGNCVASDGAGAPALELPRSAMNQSATQASSRTSSHGVMGESAGDRGDSPILVSSMATSPEGKELFPKSVDALPSSPSSVGTSLQVHPISIDPQIIHDPILQPRRATRPMSVRAFPPAMRTRISPPASPAIRPAVSEKGIQTPMEAQPTHSDNGTLWREPRLTDFAFDSESLE